MTVYVCYANGYNQGYGVEYYLLGVFDTKEEAQKHGCYIEVELNQHYPLVPKYDPWDKRGWEVEDEDDVDDNIDDDDSPVDYENDKFIGGYIE